MHYSIVIDIGGTFIKFGLVTSDGTIIQHLQVPTPLKKEKIMDSLLTNIHQLKAHHSVSAIGVSVPGTSDKKGTLLLAGALTDLYGYPLGTELQKHLNLPVYVENDANCAGLAELWLGNGQESQNFICMTLGTGVGGAILLNKQLYRGSTRNAGEFGLMIVNKLNYDIDVFYSSLNLYGSVQNGLVRLYNKYASNHKSDSGKEIYDLFQNNELAAQKAVNEFLRALSIGLLNVTSVLDPDLILIGGGISSNKQFISDLNDSFTNIWKQHGHIKHRNQPQIKSCFLGNDAGILGAAFLTLQK